jgi:2-polyprenyl-3-methyl-5-hydroxy-6-metoxy-1,4-benzoquinol methylase
VNERIIVPEILDSLDPGHPDAIRSRRDLRKVDVFLGGSRWILRTIRHLGMGSSGRIIELGAGEGLLAGALAAAFPGVKVVALDLQSRPPLLPEAVEWRSGNLFETTKIGSHDVVVGHLILHHFDRGKLRELGAMLGRARGMVFSEPFRSALALGLAGVAAPLAGRVTRHDMAASIRAGFRRGEIPELMGMDRVVWEIRECSLWRGVHRVVAWRR